jgi:hypothetical protein
MPVFASGARAWRELVRRVARERLCDRPSSSAAQRPPRGSPCPPRFGDPLTNDMASKFLDSSVVRVPRVFHFFQRQDSRDIFPTGYILIEFAEGERIDRPTHEQIKQIANTIENMATLHGPRPGGLQGNRLLGSRFEGERNLRPGSLESFNKWSNYGYYPGEKERCLKPDIDIGSSKHILYHLDVAPRNIH